MVSIECGREGQLPLSLVINKRLRGGGLVMALCFA